MTIAIEAGASQIQSSTKVISAHLIFAAGIRLRESWGRNQKRCCALKGWVLG